MSKRGASNQISKELVIYYLYIFLFIYYSNNFFFIFLILFDIIITRDGRDRDDDEEGESEGIFTSAAPAVISERKIRGLPSRKSTPVVTPLASPSLSSTVSYSIIIEYSRVLIELSPISLPHLVDFLDLHQLQ